MKAALAQFIFPRHVSKYSSKGLHFPSEMLSEMLAVHGLRIQIACLLHVCRVTALFLRQSLCGFCLPLL